MINISFDKKQIFHESHHIERVKAIWVSNSYHFRTLAIQMSCDPLVQIASSGVKNAPLEWIYTWLVI